MKRLTIAAAVAVLLCPLAADAQDSYYGSPYYGDYGVNPYYGYGYYSSTIQEGYGRGLADVIRSHGIYNRLTAEALVAREEARKQYIENYRTAVETYFHVRELNRARRHEALANRHKKVREWLHSREPYQASRLSPSELDPFTGEIRWPIVLRDAAYDKQRETLNKMFAFRANLGFLDVKSQAKVESVGNSMLTAIKDRISEYRPMNYVTARRFLESLINEAAYPAS